MNSPIQLPRVLGKVSRLLRKAFTDSFSVLSYAQEGEDMVLARLFEAQTTGFYVDVGAHHPKRFSNTYYFYKRGWRGINIEPNPDAAPLFARARSRDTTLTLGVSDVEGEMTYYRFNEPALNSFDETLSNSRVGKDCWIVGTSTVPVRRLDNLLRAHLPAGTAIDFLTVDVEGHDLQVLRSNDWTVSRPRCVIVEALDSRIATLSSTPVHHFLVERGYVLFGKTVHSLFYLDEKDA